MKDAKEKAAALKGATEGTVEQMRDALLHYVEAQVALLNDDLNKIVTEKAEDKLGLKTQVILNWSIRSLVRLLRLSTLLSRLSLSPDIWLFCSIPFYPPHGRPEQLASLMR